jgi:hypothetical protein
MATELEIKTIDRRTSPRYLARGFVSQADYDKYLQALPDVADKSENVTTEQPMKSNAQ